MFKIKISTVLRSPSPKSHPSSDGNIRTTKMKIGKALPESAYRRLLLLPEVMLQETIPLLCGKSPSLRNRERAIYRETKVKIVISPSQNCCLHRNAQAEARRKEKMFGAMFAAAGISVENAGRRWTEAHYWNLGSGY